jgi:hypothetical protein
VESCDIQITRIGRGLQKYIHPLNHTQYLKLEKSIIYANLYATYILYNMLLTIICRLGNLAACHITKMLCWQKSFKTDYLLGLLDI